MPKNAQNKIPDSDQETGLIAQEEKTPARPLMPIIIDHQEMIADFLPDHVDSEKFFLIANGILRGSKSLRECLGTKAGVAGFLGSLKQAAMDGLMPDGKREAAIVPYGGVPTYVRMYHGMMKMMRQSGEILDINTGLVCENDKFDFCRGTENYVRHKQAFTKRGKKVAAWCVIRTKDGGEYFDIMGADEIIAIKNAAKAKKGPWGNAAHEGQMWRKTILRRTSNLAPLSTDMQNSFAKEDEENYNFDHLQKPSASERLVANMAKKERGNIIDLDPSHDDDPDPDTDPGANGDRRAQEDREAEMDVAPKIELPADPAKMDGEQWETFTNSLIEDLNKRGISGKEFDQLYKPELDHMANLSVADFDRILDAMESADGGKEKK